MILGLTVRRQVPAIGELSIRGDSVCPRAALSVSRVDLIDGADPTRIPEENVHCSNGEIRFSADMQFVWQGTRGTYPQLLCRQRLHRRRNRHIIRVSLIIRRDVGNSAWQRNPYVIG